jgi:hypothetical protein
VKARRTLGWLAFIGGFVAVLVYATVASVGPQQSGANARGGPGAAEACKVAVSARVTSARFPFATNVTDLGGGAYQLQGMVDERLGTETVRRNYECTVHYAGTEGYRADSVRIWQSH